MFVTLFYPGNVRLLLFTPREDSFFACLLGCLLAFRVFHLNLTACAWGHAGAKVDAGPQPAPCQMKKMP